MSGWAIVALAFGIPAALLLIVVAWACMIVAGDADRRAEIMQRRCEHSYWPWRWTEDGWVKVCRVCGDPAYGGDDAAPVEPE